VSVDITGAESLVEIKEISGAFSQLCGFHHFTFPGFPFIIIKYKREEDTSK
jgi:hypothetical protein